MNSLLQPDLSSRALILTTQPLPVPDSNSTDHLIRVHAAALTSGELLWMQNISPTSKLNNLVPCFDMSGTTITAPSDSPFQPGSEVYACTDFYRPGAGREYTLCATSELAFKPKTLSFAQAATVPMSVETAYQALFIHASLRPVAGTGAQGKRVFVTGASGAAGMVRT
jgi:NADPH:quinone reductase-like Zn-dependent oxidoreductase